MLKISIRTKGNIPFTLPIPYSLLHLCSRIITTKFIWKRMTQISNQPFIDSSGKNMLNRMRREQLKPMIKELQNHRGMELVNVESPDGIRVRIKL